VDESVPLPDGVLGVDEGCAAFERGPDERPNLPLACDRARRRRQQHGRQSDARRERPPAVQRTKIPRNRRANGDTVTSPASSENGRASALLFASKINVNPRNGAVRIIDEDPLSETPNCHTIGSPL